MPDRPKRILIVAGEASADTYGARLVRRLQLLHGTEALEFYGAGGDAMRQAGVRLISHIRDLAHIGPREVVSSLRTYHRTFHAILDESTRTPPKVAVLLDFPDFNLRLAKRMKRLGVTTIYYISPQVWAWRSGRVRTIRRAVDRMQVILPFEEDYYRERGVAAEFVGHPLLEEFTTISANREEMLAALHLDPRRRTIAILAGSRRKEIDYILPTLLRAGRRLLDATPAQFVISVAPSIGTDHVQQVVNDVLGEWSGAQKELFRISTQRARDILANADFAFVKSGTSTLEAALVGTPFLIAYRISPLSWFAGSILIRSSMKGLVNLIAQRGIVPELYQREAEPEALARVALEYLDRPEKGAEMRRQLAGIRTLLGARVASETVAATVSSYL